jgi:exodeoxyribonuclease VII small subunit
LLEQCNFEKPNRTGIMEKKKQTYKDAIAEIEEILEKLENEELDVDDLAIKIKRVSLLLKFCKDKLIGTEKEIQNIIEEMGS